MGSYISEMVSIELQNIETVLKIEAQDRVVDKSNECSLFDCLAQCLNFQLERIQSRGYYNSDRIRTSVIELLGIYKKQFLPVFSLQIEDFPVQISNDELNEIFQMIISDIRAEENECAYTRICLYAAATCVNTPIYVLCKNKFERWRWSYFPPLFTYEGQPQCVVSYVTMANMAETCFYKIETRDMSVPRPNATGLVGMHLDILEDTSPLDTDVPAELLQLSDEMKSKLCHSIPRDILFTSCGLFLQTQLIETDAFNILTKHKASRQEFCSIVTKSQEAYKIVCQVLINRRQKTVLSEFVSSWNSFENSCEYLRQFESLAALDTAIYSRNISVSNFLISCQASGKELDERRKNVTTAVIASSSVGILSGGMFIAGQLLAPFTFGSSLTLSIVGEVIGAGSGVVAGFARAFEAIKQNSKMDNIRAEQKKIQEREQDVARALSRTEELFKIKLADSSNHEEIGISRRGFLAVGSAIRATNSIAHVAFSTASFGTTAARVVTVPAAAALGPLSLVFDIAFLAEAAHCKAKGDKTNAGEILHSIAETIEAKSKIFNSILRGNLPDDERMTRLH